MFDEQDLGHIYKMKSIDHPDHILDLTGLNELACDAPIDVRTLLDHRFSNDWIWFGRQMSSDHTGSGQNMRLDCAAIPSGPNLDKEQMLRHFDDDKEIDADRLIFLLTVTLSSVTIASWISRFVFRIKETK